MKISHALFGLVWCAGLLAGPATAGTIVVGQVGPMSGMEANQGRAYAVGMQLYFNTINKAGGVNGHTFTLTRKDDGGRPDDTVANTRLLLAQEQPMVLAGFIGTRNIQALVATGLLAQEKVALVATAPPRSAPKPRICTACGPALPTRSAS